MRTWPASSRWLREGAEEDMGRDRELLMIENSGRGGPAWSGRAADTPYDRRAVRGAIIARKTRTRRAASAYNLSYQETRDAHADAKVQVHPARRQDSLVHRGRGAAAVRRGAWQVPRCCARPDRGRLQDAGPRRFRRQDQLQSLYPDRPRAGPSDRAARIRDTAADAGRTGRQRRLEFAVLVRAGGGPADAARAEDRHRARGRHALQLRTCSSAWPR